MPASVVEELMKYSILESRPGRGLGCSVLIAVISNSHLLDMRSTNIMLVSQAEVTCRHRNLKHIP